MTTPNHPQEHSSEVSRNETAYQLGKLIGNVVEEIDRHLNIGNDKNHRNSLDLVKEDPIELEKDELNTYESKSQRINRKWKRY